MLAARSKGWLGALLFACSATTAIGGNWPAWRGPEGNGICREGQLPLRWSAKQNLRWRVALPDRGNSTPIVWDDSVFITQALEDEQRRTVMSFDRRDGTLRWQAGPTYTEADPTHEENPHCSPSPVTDGQRVIAWFGSAGLYAYDLNGRELWRRDLGRQSHPWGYASSPVLYGDLCLLNFGPGPRSFLIGLNKRTGALLWTCSGPNIGAYSSPFFRDGIVAVAVNGFTNLLMAVRPGGRGDVTTTHRLWHLFPASSRSCIGSGVIRQGRLYQTTYMGFAQCLDLQTGRTLWEERLTGTGARNSSWSSPVLAGDRLYVPNQNADVFVLRAGPEFECLATNSIGGEPMNASLAVSDGAVFLRTHLHLWCFADGKTR